jgi:hypothetical protein
MAEAMEQPVVTLLLAAYKGGRGRLDDIFLFGLQKSKLVLSSLLMDAQQLLDGDNSHLDSKNESEDEREEKSSDDGSNGVLSKVRTTHTLAPPHL